ncbi:MAG: endolytic transglycosylase MltG [Burkholderiaceae bacterium]|nr:endolytic transglycosylase MltG [Burkholderiaceae bacterium]
MKRKPALRRVPAHLLLAVLLALVLGAASLFSWWAHQPLHLAADRVEFSVPPGASLRTAADAAVAGGVHEPGLLLGGFFRLAARGRTIKPGDYAVTAGMTPGDLLGKLIRGDRIVLMVTFIEGWHFKQARAALAQAPGLRHDTAQLSGAQIMTALGRPGVAPEGRFFPDTYHYFRHASDLDILRQSLHEMDQHLAAAWDARASGLPLKSPDDALTLASLIEKETGRAEDRAEIAGVFINRLRADMPLQTDPSVIYGLGEKFDGNLRRADLQADTPWNTYLRRGLPPTPIALPGQASLLAAVQPAATRALYFVARGDGSSQFSETLDAHNRAVDQYQRGRQAR